MSSDALRTPRGGRLQELTADQSWEALATYAVGRLVWHSDDRPHVVPVNYVAHDGAVWLRTTPYGEIARACTHRLVAFEADDIDAATRSGTSVVVIGVAEPQHRLPPGLVELDTWAGGTRSMLIRIEAAEISGRRLVPA